MSYHPNLPILALSSRVSKLVSLPALSNLVHGAELDGIDIDFSHRSWFVRPRDITAPAGYLSPICSIWLPRSMGQPAQNHTTASELADFAGTLAASLWQPLLVLDRPDPSGEHLPVGEYAKRVEFFRRQSGGEDLSLVVALRSSDLHGTREHLMQLSALRRAAEEWDFWVALDLLGSIDNRWEAEAAVTRLMPRLRLIRLADCAMRRSAGTHAYMTGRAIAAAFDCGFTGTLSLAPRMPIWRRAYPVATLPHIAELSQSLRERFALIAHIESLPRSTQYHPYL